MDTLEYTGRRMWRLSKKLTGDVPAGAGRFFFVLYLTFLYIGQVVASPASNPMCVKFYLEHIVDIAPSLQRNLLKLSEVNFNTSRSGFGFVKAELKAFGVLPNSMAARFVVLSQHDMLLRQNGEPNCGPVCLSNSFVAMEVGKKRSIDPADIKARHSENIDLVVNAIKAHRIFGGRNNSDGTFAFERAVAAFRWANRNQEPFSMSIKRMGVDEGIRPIDLQSDPESLTLVSINVQSRRNGERSRHAMVILGVDLKKKLLIYSDPNAPAPRIARYIETQSLAVDTGKMHKTIRISDERYGTADFSGLVNSVERLTMRSRFPFTSSIRTNRIHTLFLAKEKNKFSEYYMNTVEVEFGDGRREIRKVIDIFITDSAQTSYLLASHFKDGYEHFEAIPMFEIREIREL